MTIPIYLNSAFNFLETVGETDVANAITRILSQSALVGWTTSGGNTTKSPANSVGQQITFLFTRISASNLQVQFTDSQSRTWTRRAQTGGTYTERLYCNNFGIFWDPSNGEGFWGSILDATPDLQNAHDQTFAGHASRTVADALDGLFVTAGHEQLNAASPRAYVPVGVGAVTYRGNYNAATPELGGLQYSESLSRLWHPMIFEGISSGAEHRIRGRVFQGLYVGNPESPQSEFSVPLDEANTGLFKILAFTTGSAGLGFDFHIAVRKA